MVQIFSGPDGRRLAFAETGTPAGPAVFYFHGWPACHLEAALIEDMPVRLIAVDRPGYGESGTQRGRRLLDWPEDVSRLADYLGIDQFDVVGVSGGAPYALACAWALARVKSVALISPLPPLAPGASPPDVDLGPGLVRLRWLGGHPLLGRALVSAIRMGVRAGLLDPENVLDGASAARDAACLTPAIRRRLVAAWREGLKHGGAGAVADARIYASDWGFALSDIRKPVSLWHGSADRVVPLATLAAYDSLAARRHVLAEEGHYSLALTRAAAIVAELIAG
jgi:pimeloyl-ACP methyl ester carboxylesterase